MNALRSFLAVVVGYALFAVAAVLLFRVLGQDPHRAAPLWIMVLSAVYGSAFALLGAFVAVRIAGYRPLAHGAALAAVIALGASVSLVQTLGHGSIWSQIAALVAMAPSALLGGWLQARPSSLAKNQS